MEAAKLKWTLILGLVFLSHTVFSQWEESQINVFLSIPEIALIDIESLSTNDVKFMVVPTGESGENPEIMETSNKTLWINYSSALSNSNSTRSIVAEISQGQLPDGILMFLEASEYSGAGGGQVGHPAEKIDLSNQPRPIITEIGSCYTGDGVNNGHLLTFSLEVSDYSRIHAVDESAFTVLYTITDN